jgi:transposase
LQRRGHAAPSRRHRRQVRAIRARHPEFPPGRLARAKALKTRHNLSLMPLPPRSPGLNSQENIWQFMRANWLSNRVFKSYDNIVDHCCFA